MPGEVVADLGGLHLELDALVVLEGLADDDDPGQSRAHLLLKVAAGRGVDQLAEAEGEDGVVDGNQARQIHPITERRERLQDLPQRDRPLHTFELDVVPVHLEHPLEVVQLVLGPVKRRIHEAERLGRIKQRHGRRDLPAQPHRKGEARRGGLVVDPRRHRDHASAPLDVPVRPVRAVDRATHAQGDHVHRGGVTRVGLGRRNLALARLRRLR